MEYCSEDFPQSTKGGIDVSLHLTSACIEAPRGTYASTRECHARLHIQHSLQCVDCPAQYEVVVINDMTALKRMLRVMLLEKTSLWGSSMRVMSYVHIPMNTFPPRADLPSLPFQILPLLPLSHRGTSTN